MRHPLTIEAPPVDGRYWSCLGAASVCGADLGDVCAHVLGLGHWRGLPAMAMLFVLAVTAARRAGGAALLYWIAIVLVRAAATNLSDLQFHDLAEPDAVVIGREAMLLPPLVLFDRRDRAAGRAAEAGPLFWATMLVAGTLGTTIGDDLATRNGFGAAGASCITTLVLLAGAGWRWRRAAPRTAARGVVSRGLAYWATVLAIRTWGTNIGDFSSDLVGLPEGLAASAALLLGLVCVPRPWAARTGARPWAARPRPQATDARPSVRPAASRTAGGYATIRAAARAETRPAEGRIPTRCRSPRRMGRRPDDDAR